MPARQRGIHCSAEERAAIGRRAEAAGMSFSRFMVACAPHGADDDGGEADAEGDASPGLEAREGEGRITLGLAF